MWSLGAKLFAVSAMLFVMLGATGSQIRVVRKAAELAQAIDEGAQHIVIVEHLDLRSYPARPAIGGESVLFPVSKDTKSITVRELYMPPFLSQ
jgi:hypothetical protein